jgi:hypothetical protein
MITFVYELESNFYSNKVEQTTLSFPNGILTNFLHIAEMIEELGPALGLPYTKAIGEGLFEIRAKPGFDSHRQTRTDIIYNIKHL